MGIKYSEKVKNDRIKHYVLFFVFLIVIIFIFSSDTDNTNSYSSSKTLTNNKTISYDPDYTYWQSQIVLENPYSGKTWSTLSGESIAPFSIKTSGDTNYLVKLEDYYNSNNYILIFIKGGDNEKIDVPLGKYYLKYASGKNWYGIYAKDHRYFGQYTSFTKSDSILNFSIDYENENYIGQQITLYPVVGGNMSTQDIDSKDF